jgi:hypothetical protein
VLLGLDYFSLGDFGLCAELEQPIFNFIGVFEGGGSCRERLAFIHPPPLATGIYQVIDAAIAVVVFVNFGKLYSNDILGSG